MLRVALLGLVVTWCIALVRLTRTWRVPVAMPAGERTLRRRAA